MGDYYKALEFVDEALIIRETSLPPNHPDLAESYINIGEVYNKMSDYSKALEFYEKAHEIYEKALPSNHPDLATSYNNIGLVYNSKGDYSKAFEFHKKAHQIYTKALPQSHPSLSASYNNMGLVCDTMGDYSKALEFYEKANTIAEKTLTSNHPDLATFYNNIGRLNEMVYLNSQIVDSMVPHRNVNRIQFGILSPDEIRRMSVTNPPIEYVDLLEEGKANIQGLMDPRQGPPDQNSKCHTCAGSYVECPGHFGHIECQYLILFFISVFSILRCVCFHCSKLLVDPNDSKIIDIIKKTKEQYRRRLAYVFDACKGQRICQGTKNQNHVTIKTSDGCGRKQPIYRRSGLELTIEWKQTLNENEGTRSKLSAARVLEIFQKISDPICEILGMNPQQTRPDWMILTVLPVPPMCVRPSISSFDDVTHCHDDLTYNLANIIKANNILREHEQHGEASHIIEEDLQHLQYHCATLIDNNKSGIPKSCQKSGTPLKSIKERLEGPSLVFYYLSIYI
ncbi:unnamed protein product [Rotaria sp. Silwood1]|nr:unnamed protein product [Rotaria sp. Silwood1]CAF4759416.1 unnamed protein product [Rotaria sp. Silwood1]